MNHFQAGFRAAVFHSFFTIVTLYEKQVAGVINTVGMVVARFAALLTAGNNIRSDALAQTVDKHKVFSDKFTLQFFGFHLAGIFYDSAFKLIDTFETFVLKESTCFFTPDASGAIHQKIFVFLEQGYDYHNKGYPHKEKTYPTYSHQF